VEVAAQAHMRHLVEQIQTLEARLREGGGKARIDRQHQAWGRASRAARTFRL
jgi:hypothetical protein